MPPTRHENSWDALVLATMFMHMHLKVMLECGGRLLDAQSGSDVRLGAFFPEEFGGR